MRTVNFEKLLPADLPPGERILWHGRPDWLSMTRRAFRADLVAIYFAVMTVWNCVTARDGAWPMAAAQTLAAGFAALALLALLGWLSARTTLYVVTSGRIVMKIGVALPVFFNLPYSQIESAAARVFTDGTGDISLALTNGQRIAYLHLWPHARPLRVKQPEPTLRCVPDAAKVAEILCRAVIARSDPKQVAISEGERPAPSGSRIDATGVTAAA
jgi:Bacterial PH domain